MRPLGETRNITAEGKEVEAEAGAGDGAEVGAGVGGGGGTEVGAELPQWGKGIVSRCQHRHNGLLFEATATNQDEPFRSTT